MTQKKDEKQALRVKKSIFTNMVMLPFIPFMLAIGVSFYYFTTALENKTTGSLERVVADHGQMIESFLAERQADLELITRTYNFTSLNNVHTLTTVFENLKHRSAAFVDIGIFDRNGIHVKYCGPYPLKGREYKNERWFKAVMKSGFYISDVFLGYRNVPHFIIAVRQRGKDGDWVLRATIDTLFFDHLVSQVRIGKTGEAYILNQRGIAQTQHRMNGFKIMEQDPDFINFPKPQKDKISFIHTGISGTTYLYAVSQLKNRQWHLVVRQEKKDAYTLLYSAIYLNLLIMITGGAVIIVMAFFISGRISKAIDKLGKEKENLGFQLIRAAQLAEIGEMAAGFAHEINNPLQIIKNEHALITACMSEIAEKQATDTTPQNEEIQESMDQIRLQIERCAEITRAILKFGRENEYRDQLVDPASAIPEIIDMVKKKAGLSSITIKHRIAPEAPFFIGASSQFQQVMLNLLNNAVDAVTELHGSSGGMVEICAQQSEEGELHIQVTDNGIGIDEDNLKKIFSPFFTTKPVGKGTGLGLSVCYGIIESFGGRMSVKSEKNIGTTFTITLPPADRQLTDRQDHY